MKRIVAIFAAIVGASVFAGPRITILGDSYSTFEGYNSDNVETWYKDSPPYPNDVTKVEETWWWQVVQGLGGQLERNNSYSGSTICYAGYRKGGSAEHQDYSDRAFVTRVQFYMGEPDIIFVCGGTNDSWAGSPIGTNVWENWTTADLWTFRGGMAKMCDTLRTKFPDAKVYFILNSELRPSINDAVHEICAHYSIPCIDLHDIDKQRSHPSVKGMKAIADQVLQFVTSQNSNSKTP